MNISYSDYISYTDNILYTEENIEINEIIINLYIFLLFFINFIFIMKMFSYILSIADNDMQYQKNSQKVKIDYERKYDELLKSGQNMEFYNENTYNCDLNDDRELIWKRRILMEYVEGHGNIIMFYDSYRCGFCYYSDLSSVPYNALVVVAYKYAFTYKCISYLMREENTEEDNDNNQNTLPPLKKTNVYQINSLEEKMRNKSNISEKDNNNKACVKIIRMGKICDFFLLGGKPKTNTENTNIAVKSIDYKDFISQRRRMKE